MEQLDQKIETWAKAMGYDTRGGDLYGMILMARSLQEKHGAPRELLIKFSMFSESYHIKGNHENTVDSFLRSEFN